MRTTFSWLTILYNKDHTLSRTIMDVKHDHFGDKPLIFHGPVFRFHDCGRRSISDLFVLRLESQHVHPLNATRRAIRLHQRRIPCRNTFLDTWFSQTYRTKGPIHLELEWLGKKKASGWFLAKEICWCLFALCFYMSNCVYLFWLKEDVAFSRVWANVGFTCKTRSKRDGGTPKTRLVLMFIYIYIYIFFYEHVVVHFLGSRYHS